MLCQTYTRGTDLFGLKLKKCVNWEDNHYGWELLDLEKEFERQQLVYAKT
jgi:hypothetical protein